MKIFLCLLMLASIAMAQPLASVAVGLQPTDALKKVRMERRGEFLDVFFVSDDSAGHNVILHTVLGHDPLRVIQEQEVIYQSDHLLLSVEASSATESAWSLLVRGTIRSFDPEPVDTNMYVVLCGVDNELFVDTVYIDSWHMSYNNPPCDTLLMMPNMFLSGTGKLFITCVSARNSAHVCLMSAVIYDSPRLGSSSRTERTGWDSGNFTLQTTMLLGGDTLVYSLYQEDVGSGFLRFVDDAFEAIDQECGGAFRLMAESDSGAILGFTDNSAYELASDGTCLDSSYMGWFVGPRYWNQDYGLVLIKNGPWGTMLEKWDNSFGLYHIWGYLGVTTGLSLAGTFVVILQDGAMMIPYIEQDSLRVGHWQWEQQLYTPWHESPVIPSDLSLSSFPNPFNSTVTIQYDLPQAGHAKLTAYDLQGRVVANIFDSFVPAGSAELHWSPENLASGVYFLNLEAPLAHASHKILYLK